MLRTINEVNENFFKLFFNWKITVDGIEKKVLERYARKSSFDYVEEQENQVYPCIAILDYSPNLKSEWFVDMKEYSGGLSEDKLTAYLFKRPVWMEFKYDVSIASKSYKEHTLLKDTFSTEFMSKDAFIFNAYDLGIEGEVGDVVPYTLRSTDIPRRDGVFETNFEFTLSVWLYLTEPREVETVQKIILKLHQKNLE